MEYMVNIHLMDLFTEGIIDGFIGYQFLGGDDLTIGGSMTVDVSVVALKRVGITSVTGRLDEEYIEQVKVVNKDDAADFCIINVSMVVPINYHYHQ